MAATMVEPHQRMAGAIDVALTELTRDRSVMSPSAANQEVYALIKNGVRVKVRNAGDVSPRNHPWGLRVRLGVRPQVAPEPQRKQSADLQTRGIP